MQPGTQGVISGGRLVVGVTLHLRPSLRPTVHPHLSPDERRFTRERSNKSPRVYESDRVPSPIPPSVPRVFRTAGRGRLSTSIVGHKCRLPQRRSDHVDSHSTARRLVDSRPGSQSPSDPSPLGVTLWTQNRHLRTYKRVPGQGRDPKIRLIFIYDWELLVTYIY